MTPAILAAVVFLSCVAGIGVGILLMFLRQREDLERAYQRGREETREQLEGEKTELAHKLGEKLVKMRDSLRDSVEAYQGAVEALVGSMPVDMRIAANDTQLIELSAVESDGPESVDAQTAEPVQGELELQETSDKLHSSEHRMNGSGRADADLPSVS